MLRHGVTILEDDLFRFFFFNQKYDLNVKICLEKKGKKKKNHNTSISLFPYLLNKVAFALVGWHSSNNLINKLKMVEVINLQREIKERAT